MALNANGLVIHDSKARRDISSSTSGLERRTPNSIFSNSDRLSADSSKTGGSSTSTSQQSRATASRSNGKSSESSAKHNERSDVDKLMRDGRRNHRSHRHRARGGFLLASASERTFEAPQLHLQDNESGSLLRSPEKWHTKKISQLESSRDGSHLRANTGRDEEVAGLTSRDSNTDIVALKDEGSTTSSSSSLDVDSAQIVNLALNLSESRRNASRRVVSLPPASGGISESFVGGSLRQHLQAQRRIPRTVSPKPERADRANTMSPRVVSGQRIHSPLQAAFDNKYHYYFSPSTLARAEKAKIAFELMFEYRRLLVSVPPLKPRPIERATTASTGTELRTQTSSLNHGRRSIINSAGRPYNPLQYIRNRKLRARTSKAIDGQAQGFGNVEKVRAWVDEIVRAAESCGNADKLMIPPFSQESGQGAASPQTSPQSSLSKNQNALIKTKRPRIDWMMTPPDLLADVFWLEQDGNKSLIEDRHGRRLFPQHAEIPESILDNPETINQHNVLSKHESDHKLRIDTKLPEFKSVKTQLEQSSENAATRVRHKFRDATQGRHSRNGPLHNSRSFLRSRSKSSSDSSDSETLSHRRRARSRTASSHDREKDILEKQMMAIIAKEYQENDQNTPRQAEAQKLVEAIEASRALPKSSLESSRRAHYRSTSLVNSEKHSSSGRPSLEVPGARQSIEFDSSTPNSPQPRAQSLSNVFIQDVELSPTKSRQSSPSRGGFSKVKARMRPFYERNHDSMPLVTQAREQTHVDPEEMDMRRRSLSPVKRVNRTTNDGQKLAKSGSIRRQRAEDVSGIRGLFKGSRNPVTKVGDIFWRKEASPSSEFSTDESDMEDHQSSRSAKDKGHSRESSAGLLSEDAREVFEHNVPSFLKDMPTFTSPFEKRGRTIRAKANEDFQQRLLSNRAVHRTQPIGSSPRIDIQNASPASSPDRSLPDRERRYSSVSETSRRNSSNVHDADARLNAILGLPGRRRNALPMTGLANLEVSREVRPSANSQRHWSISDRDISVHRGPMTKQEVIRVRALLLSSGIKAKEIQRRATELVDFSNNSDPYYAQIAPLVSGSLVKVPKSQEHKLAARILADDIQMSARMWQSGADTFTSTFVSNFVDQTTVLQTRLLSHLTPLTRSAADEADDVSKDLVTSQTLQVKSVTDKIDKMIRRRRRRFRWVRRGGWVMLEWALVGIMWWVWFMVMIVKAVIGLGNGIISSIRWLLWL